jgi:hypothetical protein
MSDGNDLLLVDSHFHSAGHFHSPQTSNGLRNECCLCVPCV